MVARFVIAHCELGAEPHTPAVGIQRNAVEDAENQPLGIIAALYTKPHPFADPPGFAGKLDLHEITLFVRWHCS